MTVEEILLRLTGDSSGAETALKRLSAELAPLKQKIDQVGQAGKAMGLLFGGLSAAGGKLIQSTSKVAMRNEVLAVSLYAVGERAGYTRQELDAIADSVKGMGITTSNARLSVTRMIQSQLDLSKATDLARTAQNLAVISGENSSVAYEKIMEAITSLQPRLLRQYGIVATTNQILGDLAKSTDSVAQRNRFLQFVLEEGEKVAGVYESAMGVVGKQLSSFPRYIEEAQAALGKHFIPIIGKGAQILKALIKWFEALPDGVQKALATFILFGTGISLVLATLGGLMAALPVIVGGLGTLAGAVIPALPLLAALAAAIGALIAVGAILRKAWLEDWGGLRTAVMEAWTQIKPLIDQFVALFRAWGGQLLLQFKRVGASLWNLIKTVLEPLLGNVSNILGQVDWAKAFGRLSDTLNVAFGWISAWLNAINGLLRGEGLRAFKPLEEAFIDVLTLIALAWGRWIKKGLTWGWNLVVQITNGIIRAAQSVLVATLRALGNLVGRFLAPGSPPKEGPLSRIAEWGKGVMATYLKSFALADFSLMRDALSPIRDALQAAVSAGDIDEAEFASIFTNVREQVAGLIAEFRETGEISEEALGQIAESLGPGSEELVKYLRLQLEHQKALEHLKEVQEEVDEARERGFVSAELKEKLKNAEESAAAAKEELDWQREYLAMQQESVDLQTRLAEALEGVAEALDRISGGAEAGAGAGGEGGIEDVLGFDSLELNEVGDALEAVKAKIGGMTPEFETMRAKVVAWISEIREFLSLPLPDKLLAIAQYLQQATGIDFPGFLQEIFNVVKSINEKGLLNTIKEWVGKGLEYIEDNWEGWAEHVATFIFEAFVLAIELLAEQIEQAKANLSNWFQQIISRFLTWIEQKYPEWSQKIKDLLVRMMQLFLSLLKTTAARWTSELVSWFKGIVEGFVSDALNRADSWIKGLKEVGKKMVRRIENGISAAWDMVNYIGGLLGGLAASITSGGWLDSLSSVGQAIIDKIKAGITAGWSAFISWLRGLLQDIANQLPFSEPKDPRSPLRNLSAAGRALAENFAAGVDFSPVRTALMTELGRTQRALAAGVGGVTVYQNIEGGLNFPNVKDERDALGVRLGIDRQALAAGMMARTRA